MSDQKSKAPTHEHEGFFERILHHHMGQQTEEKMKDHHEDHDEEEEAPHEQGQKRDSALEKMKEYLNRDEELEEEGETYAGLM